MKLEGKIYEFLEQNPSFWIQNSMYKRSEDKTEITGACSMGLMMLFYGEKEFDDRYKEFSKATVDFTTHFCVQAWNDHKRRVVGDVIAAFKKVNY